MPIFPELNIIYIHIPKTGGTSVENYFSDVNNIPKDSQHMYNFPLINNHRRQHCTFSELSNHVAQISNYKIFATVRNPIHRIISEVLYLAKYWNIIINGDTIDDKIRTLLTTKDINAYDNHILPQYKYLTYDNGSINKNINIMYTESLTIDMKNHGFTDFNIKEFVTERDSNDYDSMISIDTRKLILEYYKTDCKLFYPHLLEPSSGINYLGSFNWTNDIPKGSRQKFEDILTLLPSSNQPKILMIGPFVGTCLIGILRVLPNATGYVMTNWNHNCEDNTEEIFIANIYSSKLHDRIMIVQGDNNLLLNDLINNKKPFDLVYMDNSNEYQDIKVDITLVRKCLKIGGIICIDKIYQQKVDDGAFRRAPRC